MRLLVFLLTFPFVAQGQTFEVASITPNTSGASWSTTRGGPGTSDPVRIAYTNVTATAILLRAYDLQPYQLSAPEWMSSRRYDVVATVPPGASKEEFGKMLQHLLAESFHLVAHTESRELRGFDLTLRGSPRLKAAAAAEAGPLPSGPPKLDAEGYPILDHPGIYLWEARRGNAVVVFLTAKAQPVSVLSDRIGREFRVPVADKTSLAGLYDFRLEFAPQPPGALPPASPDADAATPDTSAPNLLTAVQQQLGLRLSPAKVRVGMLVVDSADQVPAGN